MLSDEDLECLVCNEDFTAVVGSTTSPRLLVQCGHSLCLDCAQKVLSCPMCRVEFPQSQGHVRHRLLERLIAAITKPGESGGERDYSTVISELLERQLKEGARVAMLQQHRKLLAEEVTRRQHQQQANLLAEEQQASRRAQEAIEEAQQRQRDAADFQRDYQRYAAALVFQQAREEAASSHSTAMEDRGNSYVSRGVAADFHRRTAGVQQFKTVEHFAFTPDGYFMIRDNGRSNIVGESSALRETIDGYCVGGLTYLTYSTTDYPERFYCEDSQGSPYWNFDDDAFEAAVESEDKTPVRVALGLEDGWIVVFDDDTVQMGGGLPRTLYNKIRSRNRRTHVLQEVSLGPDEQWFIKWESGRTDWCLYGAVSEAASDLENEGRTVQNIHFGPGDAFLIRCTAD